MPDSQQVVQGPDGKQYQFPSGTTKDQAVSYFKKKGIGVSAPKTSGAGGTWSEPSLGQKAAGMVADTLPMVGGMAGAQLGGAAGDAAGAIGGAGVGAGLGSAAKQGIRRMAGLEAPQTASQTAVEITKDMLQQGTLEGIGQGIGALLTKAASSAGPATLNAINRYLGLAKSDLPKWQKFNVQAVEDIAKTVKDQVGIKKTLPEQHAAIESVRSNVNQATERLINTTTQGRLTDLHSMIYQKGVDLIDSLTLAGRTPEAVNAVDRNVDALVKAYPVSNGNATPAELFQLRKNIGKDIKWNVEDPTDVHQMFLKSMYHDVNASIKSSLPAQQARQFNTLNKIQHNLIIARDAAAEKMVKDSLSQGPGIASRIKRAAAGAAVGGAVGGVLGTAEGHPGTGITSGAITGATLGSVGFHGRELSHGAESPVGDIKVQQTLEKITPTLARMAKTSPQAARALQIIRSVMSDEQPPTQ